MRWSRHSVWACPVAGLLAAVALVFAGTQAYAQAPKATAGAKTSAKPAPFDAGTCYECHDAIKEFHAGGTHKSVGCDACHEGLETHEAKGKGRPVTKTGSETCGSCHENQYRTLYTMNFDKTASKEKAVASGGALDKLLMPHGFTREHAEPRSHAFALYDQLVVDRSFGGRFVNKDGKAGLARAGGDFKLWDVLVDQYPGEPHKVFKPGTAAAANPVCMSCKTADHILDWAYLGDPVPDAKWSRLSKVNEFVKDVNHSLNCIFCHDPHSAKPRVIRDGLIQALSRPEKDTLWHNDPKGAKIEVKELGERGFTRKIALLSRYDVKLQCAQCHVEYNCNPGTDPVTGQPIGMADQRTNHFPLKDVNSIQQHYKDLKFGDFKHAVTGATLWKGQHPDTEVYYNSTHQKEGVECSACHMPKVKDPKTGKTFTSHWQTSPKHYIKETCLTCHKTWTEQQAVYSIDSLKNKWVGKMRKAEFWLTRLVDKYEAAQNMGVDAVVLDDARVKHAEAHIHWEWWSASNGSYFHNPDQAQDSLNKSMVVAQAGIKVLDEAMAKQRAARAPAAASAPAPTPTPTPTPTRTSAAPMSAVPVAQAGR